jgi:3-dehydroquinate synthase
MGRGRTQRIHVALGPRSYTVFVGKGLIDDLPREVVALLVKASDVLIVSDRNVARTLVPAVVLGLERLRIASQRLVVRPGEGTKSVHRLPPLLETMARLGCSRRTIVLAVGGGVVGDLAGFLAAIYMRGIPVVQVPTSLVAQVDAAIGGKTAVDLDLGRNLVGAFHQPRAVVVDPLALRSLPEREYRSGLGEVVKYAVIGDPKLFSLLSRRAGAVLSRDPAILEEVVSRCIAMKARIVARDETESGERAVLNLGHTLGHALEAEALRTGTRESTTALAHGEAVAIGTAFAARLAVRRGLLDPGLARRIEDLLWTLGLPAKQEVRSRKRLIAYMARDKKRQGEGLTFVLPSAIGAVEIVRGIPASEVAAVLRDWS